MSRRRLPPLGALRAFEAAARHLSFTRAADELSVTQAAVSHQVKALEDFLGVRLFRRYNRRLELTPQGRDYLPPLRDAFDRMAEATLRLRSGGEDRQLKVSTVPSFATKWLIPRLWRFGELHPEIDPMISTTTRLVDLGSGEFDVAIRNGRGEEPGLTVVPLMADRFFPVCSPRLVENPPAPLREPADLRHHVLLHDLVLDQEGEDAPNWRNWMKRTGMAIQPEKGPAFSGTALALQAAIAGQGVALALRSLVIDDLKAGHLVCPFGPILPTRKSWYLVCTPPNAASDKVHAFCLWLQDEIARDLGEDEIEPRAGVQSPG